jgi:hypothetical protein
LWRETTYASLSTIARAITGTAWSGPRFSGLRANVNSLKDMEREPAGNAPWPKVEAAHRRGAG